MVTMKAALLMHLFYMVTALNGSGRQGFQTYDGWRAFEMVTQGDVMNGFELPGNMDGIGAYLMEGGHDIRVLVNHESPYACDIRNDASVTSLIISKPAFLQAIQNKLATGSTKQIQFITSMSIAYNSYRLKDGSSTSWFGRPFKHFCSGHVHEAYTFGTNRGFVDRLYIFGEEAPASEGYGRIFALHGTTLNIITGSGSCDAVQIQGGINGLPVDALENVAMIDTGETQHVIMILSPDYGSKSLRMYVGRKGFRTNGESCGACTGDEDILARNGLAFGSTFYLQGVLPTRGGTFSYGSFGTNRNAAVSAEKLEDVATSPKEPTKVLLGEQRTGVYEIDFDIKFVNGVFSAATSSFSITKLKLRVSNPDNVEWSADGSRYAVSDDSSGSIVRLTPDGTSSRIASSNGEASGLVDISHLLDMGPSSVLLVNSMTCPSAMSVLVNPDTDFNTPLPTFMPTQTEICGDGSCAVTENTDDCQSDCGNKSLTASSIGLFGAKGVMFTVKPSRDIVVTSLGFYKNLDDASIVEVYTRSGSYMTHEYDEEGWALVHSQAVASPSDDGMSHAEIVVIIPANKAQAFYIYTADIVLYNDGVSEGTLFKSNDSLELYEGIGITGLFSGSIETPKRYAGEIRYGIITLDPDSPVNLFTVERQTSSPESTASSPVVTEQAKSPTKRPNALTAGPSHNPANAAEQFWSNATKTDYVDTSTSPGGCSRTFPWHQVLAATILLIV